MVFAPHVERDAALSICVAVESTVPAGSLAALIIVILAASSFTKYSIPVQGRERPLCTILRSLHECVVRTIAEHCEHSYSVSRCILQLLQVNQKQLMRHLPRLLQLENGVMDYITEKNRGRQDMSDTAGGAHHDPN